MGLEDWEKTGSADRNGLQGRWVMVSRIIRLRGTRLSGRGKYGDGPAMVAHTQRRLLSSLRI
jgi:hypothetical protein